MMFVAMAKISLVLAQSHSLKEKRMVLRRIRDRVRDQLGIAVNEVGEQDLWQRAQLGVAIASAERGKALEVLDDAIRIIAASGGGDIVAIAKDAHRFDAEPTPVVIDRVESARTGSGDKAAAGDDWVPDAWREEKQS
jgi:uncharacterized protein YlxP (DUF503 family)